MDTMKKNMVLRIFGLPPRFVARMPHRTLRPAGITPGCFRRGKSCQNGSTGRCISSGRNTGSGQNDSLQKSVTVPMPEQPGHPSSSYRRSCRAKRRRRCRRYASRHPEPLLLPLLPLPLRVRLSANTAASWRRSGWLPAGLRDPFRRYRERIRESVHTVRDRNPREKRMPAYR